MYFKTKRIIEDFRRDQSSSTSYRFEAISVDDDYKVWIKYYDGDKLDNCSFDVKSICNGKFPHAYVYFQKGEEAIFSYEYEGSVIIDRKTENKVRKDVIDNFDEILSNINKQIDEMKNTPK